MTDDSIALACASGLFIGIVATAFAGADKPPPPGFLWLVVILACGLRRRLHPTQTTPGRKKSR